MPVEDPEEQLEHDTEELGQRIDRVEEHIDESRGKLKARQEDAEDWENEGADESEDQDPAGFDDPEEVDDLDVDEEA
ncbi:MAG: hypothetical protein M3459_03120 [Actinomycetota bacterium]|nr:hypothetical protein [Actinomycetota bacterium]